MIRIAILGAAGRMGQLLLGAVRTAQSDLAKDNGHHQAVQLISALVRLGHGWVEKDVGEMLAGDMGGGQSWGLLVTDRGEVAISHADLVIDFSVRTQVAYHAGLAAQAGAAFLTGVTGLLPEDEAAIKLAARHVPVLTARNTSFAVLVTAQLAAQAAALLSASDYRIVIKETHHIHKKDKPSGTALLLGQAITDQQKSDDQRIIDYQSLRLGEVIGLHEVVFEGVDDVISLKHEALNRRLFATGALRAGQWLVRQRPGLYTMEDVLAHRLKGD